MIVPKSSVYFASCKTITGIDMGVTKIGLSYDPLSRQKSLNSTEPFVCNIKCWTPGDLFLEYFCHMWLRQHHVAGEFFANCAELSRLIDHVRDTGVLPFPIRFVEDEGTFVGLDVFGYMVRSGITFSDVRKATGVNVESLAKNRCGNRRTLAAVAVTAVRSGLEIHWSRDFKPEGGKVTAHDLYQAEAAE